ncbi:MAG: hypothetical protein R3B95_11430 [Nitrospirales bacterium]|nr:hypothetical protein [Nitrospirales bacterium]
MNLNQSRSLKIGDLVEYQIHEDVGTGYIIGFWMEDPEVCVIADEGTIGMPMNVRWILRNFGNFQKKAFELRCKFEAKHPNYQLRPLTIEVVE